MLAPIEWLKEYIDITIPTKELSWRLTELGLGVEKIINTEGEEVLELEITPNRPDLLSLIGIAREIAAIEKKKIKLPSVALPKPVKKLTVTVHNNFDLFPRYTGIILDNVSVKPSPEWLQKRIKQLNLRPINNIVDITNYVMFETGIPLHAFDYNQIRGSELTVTQTQGGEEFTTVDEKSYHLPKDAIIIKDRERIIDLCGIKGGLNSGITDKTSTVFLQVTADDPLLIRRTSHALALRSDASAIFERGVDKGGLLTALTRAAGLITELGEGDVASDIIDLSEKEFNPWNLELNLKRLEKVLGIVIDKKEVISILESLSLHPSFSDSREENINVTIPTYRQDLKIEEDLIEEVARVYGYNRFIPASIDAAIPIHPVSYYKNYSFEEKVKNIISGCGYTEIYTYSLINKYMLEQLGIDPEYAVRLSNPVSLDYEYLRPTLKGNLLTALKSNIPYFESVYLFELGRIYKKEIEQNTKKTIFTESYHIAFIQGDGNYRKIKGNVEELLDRLGIDTAKISPSGFNSAKIEMGDKRIGSIEVIETLISNNFGIKNPPVYAELDFSLIEHLSKPVRYKSVSPYPASVEDVSLILKPETYIGEVINAIQEVSPVINRIELLDSYENTRTLRIYYQDRTKTLSQKDIQPLRIKIISLVETKFGALLKN